MVYLKSPSPLLIENELWLKKQELSKKDILDGVVVDNKKGLVLVSKEVSKKFDGILTDLIAQLFRLIILSIFSL